MRYAIIPKGLNLNQIEDLCKRYGGRNIRPAPRSNMVFVELDNAGFQRLRVVSGLAVKDISRKISAQQIKPPLIVASQTSSTESLPDHTCSSMTVSVTKSPGKGTSSRYSSSNPALINTSRTASEHMCQGSL